MKQLVSFLVLMVALMALAGCADVNTLTDQIRDGATSPAGFWRGLWHGICAPISLIGIMFGMDIGIYEAFNSGNWYNFGFLFGVGCWGGGGSSTTIKRRRR